MNATRNPFPGPRPYEREDAKDFFGRTAEIRELRSLIASYGVVVVVGPSGCGKSSLLRAGVIPALEQGEYEVLPIARLGQAARGGAGRGDVGAAGGVFERNVVSCIGDGMASAAATPHAAAGAATGVAAGTLLETLEARPRRLASDGAPMPRVLVIDQFEELFTTNLQAWRERGALVGALLSANRGQGDLRVVLVMRAEYLSSFASLVSRLDDGSSARERTVMYFHVERLTQEAATGVIASVLSREFPGFKRASAETLARQMSRELVRRPDGTLAEEEGEFVEPLYLQLICRSLWEKLTSGAVRPEDESLIPDADIDRELRAFVATEIGAVAAETRVRPGRIRGWLEEKFLTPAGTRGSVIREANETAGMPNVVAEGLERRHVLRAEERAAGYWYELAHDRLVAGVQMLGVEARRKRAHVTERVTQALVVGVVLFFVGRGLWTSEPAAVAAPPDLARATAERATTFIASNPEVASEWIKEALAMGEDPFVDSVAREIAARALVSRTVQKLTKTPAVAVAAAPDSIVAVGADDGRVWVVNVLTKDGNETRLDSQGGAPAVQLSEAEREFAADVRGVVPGWGGGVVGLGYAARAVKLAVAGRAGRVSLVTRPEWKRERDTTLADTLSSLAVTPTAGEIAVGTLGGSIVRLPASGGARRAQTQASGRITALAYVNERDLLAIDERGNVYGWRGGSGEPTRLWSPANAAALAATGRLSLMALAPNGSDLAVTVGDEIHLLRHRGGRVEEVGVISCEQLQGDRPSAIAFSRSGASLVIGSEAGLMTMWGVRSGRCDWSATGPQTTILAIAPLAAGSPVVTTGANLEVRLWFQPPTAREVRTTVALWRSAAEVRTNVRLLAPPAAMAK